MDLLKILDTDMNHEVRQAFVSLVDKTFSEDRPQYEMAMEIKQWFDDRCDGPWHCVIGQHFGRLSGNQESNRWSLNASQGSRPKSVDAAFIVVACCHLGYGKSRYKFLIR
ncbi:hypothetical protein CSKR_111770 [Clonorchis sinensis]|uniref:Dynein light chain n=1 Tax=Clonorchis sinensis TaxID=79923 RepID=A0A8T1MZ74_CLOSI|nr:hypothetical protein CSKR_111770 [Clonorchis sinensis]